MAGPVVVAMYPRGMTETVGARPRTTPSRIEQADPGTLAIAWADGVTSLFPVRALRLNCACAICVDEWTGASQLDPDTVPSDVQPLRLHSVGRYAIQIDWSDGHDTGIYTFERLRELTDKGVGAVETTA
jgi:ATP-binding protein involved in chromosome partitioning